MGRPPGIGGGQRAARTVGREEKAKNLAVAPALLCNWQAAIDLLRKYNICPVITDVAGRRDVLHMTLTNETAMIRFVGNDFHPTDYSRIDDWAARLNEWIHAGVKNIYFFCHEPDNLHAPELCDYFFSKIKNIKNVTARGPIFHEENGGQLSLF